MNAKRLLIGLSFACLAGCHAGPAENNQMHVIGLLVNPGQADQRVVQGLRDSLLMMNMTGMSPWAVQAICAPLGVDCGSTVGPEWELWQQIALGRAAFFNSDRRHASQQALHAFTRLQGREDEEPDTASDLALLLFAVSEEDKAREVIKSALRNRLLPMGRSQAQFAAAATGNLDLIDEFEADWTAAPQDVSPEFRSEYLRVLAKAGVNAPLMQLHMTEAHITDGSKGYEDIGMDPGRPDLLLRLAALDQNHSLRRRVRQELAESREGPHSIRSIRLAILSRMENESQSDKYFQEAIRACDTESRRLKSRNDCLEDLAVRVGAYGQIDMLLRLRGQLPGRSLAPAYLALLKYDFRDEFLLLLHHPASDQDHLDMLWAGVSYIYGSPVFFNGIAGEPP